MQRTSHDLFRWLSALHFRLNFQLEMNFLFKIYVTVRGKFELFVMKQGKMESDEWQFVLCLHLNVEHIKYVLALTLNVESGHFASLTIGITKSVNLEKINVTPHRDDKNEKWRKQNEDVKKSGFVRYNIPAI